MNRFLLNLRDPDLDALNSVLSKSPSTRTITNSLQPSINFHQSDHFDKLATNRICG